MTTTQSNTGKTKINLSKVDKLEAMAKLAAKADIKATRTSNKASIQAMKDLTSGKKRSIPETTAEKVVTEKVKKQAKANLMEEVVAHREVKYKYPEDVVDTLSRKKWRQEVRNQLRKLELEMHRIEDAQSKEYKVAKKAYDDYLKTVQKPMSKVA